MENEGENEEDRRRREESALKQNGAITNVTGGTREAGGRKEEAERWRTGRGARERGEAKKAWRVKATCTAKTTRFNETVDTSKTGERSGGERENFERRASPRR